MDIVIFIASASLLVGAGIRLARDGDVVAAGTGLGGMWVGAILVAAVTSLPELTTDVSAVWQGAPALAVGDLFGSNMANMLILATPRLSRRTVGHLDFGVWLDRDPGAIQEGVAMQAQPFGSRPSPFVDEGERRKGRV